MSSYKNGIHLIILIIVVAFLINYMIPSYVQGVEEIHQNFENVSLNLEENNLFPLNNFSLTSSTMETSNNTWSPMYGDVISVKPKDNYIIISHMGLNEYAMQSHIVISGFNETSKTWSQILQCPNGLNGPLEMNKFVCPFAVPANITKMQPIFQSGWSSDLDHKAETRFGNFFFINQPPDWIPVVFDDKLKIQEVLYDNLTSTSFSFIGTGDTLIVDSFNGTIYRSVNGSLLGPLHDFNTAQNGLLGINSLEKNGTKYVFLFVTESGGFEDGDDLTKKIPPKCNCIYRFELKEDKLTNPKLLLKLPAYLEGNAHAGGVLRIDKNGNIFVMVGSLDAENDDHRPNLANNEINGTNPDGRSGILVMDYNGKPVSAILGDSFPVNLYYSYGIRNSFGMDFDPVTGKLWDTENGPDIGDEINLVEPGFNSGFNKIDGVWTLNTTADGDDERVITLNPSGLVNFSGKGTYRTPELTWERPIGIVALGFLNSSHLGEDYKNSMFVSDLNNGYLYNFNLNENRTGLDLIGPLKDKIVNSTDKLNDYPETSNNIFGMGMGLISDIKTGPDGYLYLMKMNAGSGGILYRLVPNN